MELAARIPSNLKLHHGVTKFIFKEAVRGMLPPSIMGRAKQGFGVPIGSWFRGELRDLAHATLFDSDDGILNQGQLRKIWERHQSGIRDHSAFLWGAFIFQQWRKVFRENSGKKPDVNHVLAEATH
jgi:asparagine synthase (glutamine-hydrolysing)